MELTHTFTVSEPVGRAWAVITDLERVAPCLPGATMLGVDGEDFRGAVAVKVGPVTARYEGVARFAERDDDTHHAVVRAEGRDVGGQGNAAATIDIRLRERGSGTEVLVVTDLDLAGRVAQFGRGVIADVSGKLIGQFARRLEAEMAGTGTAGDAAGDGTPVTTRPDATSTAPRDRDPEPLDLLATGGGVIGSLARRHALPAGTALVGLVLGVLVGRTRRRRAHGPGPAGAPVLQLVLPGAHIDSRKADR
ncbi:SRPBCC family protein [Pseudonocardia sp. ICBG1293]|uniref:SRPBCC family protein n=1 Tax=Pseudonocardia sp. ICBG1293 TaxID=2844382 RepID=UPI001CCE5884|nr:SRPBCC family protein [Pseudonocardia sp. ICBG1293]